MHVLATRCVGLKRIASEVTSFSRSFPFSFPTLPRASFDGNISERSIRSINPLLLYETLISCAQKARSGLLRSPLSAAVQQDLKRGSPIWGAALFFFLLHVFFFLLSLALKLLHSFWRAVRDTGCRWRIPVTLQRKINPTHLRKPAWNFIPVFVEK